MPIGLARLALSFNAAAFATIPANAGFAGLAGLAGSRSVIVGGRPSIGLGPRTQGGRLAAPTTHRGMSSDATTADDEPFIPTERILFIECGFGNDGHGQSATKAAVRACRNAIEFNSIPSINRLVPGGYDKLKLDVLLAVPPAYREGLDLDAVRGVFPYGETRITIQDGGMVAPSGIAIEKLGDTNQDMVTVCSSVTVGY